MVNFIKSVHIYNTDNEIFKFWNAEEDVLNELNNQGISLDQSSSGFPGSQHSRLYLLTLTMFSGCGTGTSMRSTSMFKEITMATTEAPHTFLKKVKI